MHGRAIMALGILAALAAAAPAMAGKAKFEKDGTKGGVTVWTKEVEGSEIKQIKATTTINAKTTDVFDFLIVSKNFLSVMPDVVKSKKMEDCGENCGYWFQKLHHPPLKDRVYVLKVQWKFTENEDGTTTIKRWWKGTKKKKPPESGGLVLDKISGSWHFKPTDGGNKTKFTYMNHLEMGGKVPTMLVNSGAVSNAYKFLQNLKKKFK